MARRLVIWNATAPRAEEGLLAFGVAVLPGAKMAINLSEASDLKLAAARLVASVRLPDTPE